MYIYIYVCVCFAGSVLGALQVTASCLLSRAWMHSSIGFVNDVLRSRALPTAMNTPAAVALAPTFR